MHKQQDEHHVKMLWTALLILHPNSTQMTSTTTHKVPIHSQDDGIPQVTIIMSSKMAHYACFITHNTMNNDTKNPSKGLYTYST